MAPRVEARPNLDREKRVELAAKILGVDVRDDKVRAVIGSAVRGVERAQGPIYWYEGQVDGLPQTKVEKSAAKKFASALRRLEIALRDEHLNLPIEIIEGAEQAVEWTEVADHLSLGPPPFSREQGRRKVDKHLAAKYARRLLVYFNIKVSVTRPGVGKGGEKREGKFCELAAVLYGNKDAEVYDWCRKLEPDPNLHDWCDRAAARTPKTRRRRGAGLSASSSSTRPKEARSAD
jgi:hypothetical protein